MRALLEEVLAYLERRDTGSQIYCKRAADGTLHGPETRRFELAEKIQKALKELPE